MNQHKLLTNEQLRTLKEMGYTKKELESLATIKCKNFFLNDGDKPGNLIRLNEDGNINDG
jgi:hypothetical protein|tara:strand:+ start:856 stop:1035 length:180 start_codon:yes stop_codon:yes gene_type:complete